MKCKICFNDADPIFTACLLQKYTVQYIKCPVCGFIQVEQPYWLTEAYQSAIASLDVGYVARNLEYSSVVPLILKTGFNDNKRFLDYGGGYGLFVRLMRDKGYNFYRQDIYCDNVFAQNFDVKDTNNDCKFELLTAFEVFEHLENPLVEIEKMSQYSDSILFSTLLQPMNIELKSVNDWWYFAPETGQHISFYTKKSLLMIAKQFGLNLYTNRCDLHLLTTKKNPITLTNLLLNKKIVKLINPYLRSRKSLIPQDVEHIKQLIH